MATARHGTPEQRRSHERASCVRECPKIERREALKRQQPETQQKTHEALDRALGRRRQVEEEECGADEERVRRLEGRLWLGRYGFEQKTRDSL